jgi:hypothetical protein
MTHIMRQEVPTQRARNALVKQQPHGTPARNGRVQAPPRPDCG